MAPQSIASTRHRRAGLPLRTRTSLWFTQRLSALRETASSAYRVARTLPLVGLAFRLFEGVTPFGWATLAVGGLALTVGTTYAWAEITSLGIIALGTTLLAILWSLGRSGHSTTLHLERNRVTVGEQALGEITVTNTTHRSLPAARIELTVGHALADFTTHRLKSGETFAEPFAINTQRRGLVTVGPATTVRGDILGLVRRTHIWSEQHDLYIHPTTTPLGIATTGFIRDIEGATTQHLTSSDVSFHALRDYVPGDDRRTIHWKTTARTGKLMVRQFEETRRSHLLVILDVDAEAWSSEEEFETGVSAAASLIRATMVDAKEASIATQGGALKTATLALAMDSLATVGLLTAAERLPELSNKAGHDTPHASVAIIITGAKTTPTTVHNALSQLPLSMTATAVRIDPAHDVDMRSIGGYNVASIPALDDLGAAVWKSLG